MAVVHLTDRKLQSLKTERQQEDYWDKNLQGFGVRVTRRGRKSFIVMYQNRGKKRRMTLGTHPVISLADAKVKAKAVLFDAAQGNDPQSKKQVQKKAVTFEQLAEEYLERHAKVKKRGWREDARILESDLLPAWEGKKAMKIKRRDVIDVLDRIVERGSPIMANRTRALVSKIFNFGIGRDLVEHNPCIGASRPGKEKQRDRVLSEDEIRSLWQALGEEDPVMAGTFKLRLLTAQRGIEVLSMRWENIDGDWWTIPATVTKNGFAHRVFLAPESLELLADLRRLTGASPWVFESPRGKRGHITAVQKAKARISRRAGVDFVAHDLRRTAASNMTSMGIPRLVVSKILNHVESGITAVYDRHSYDPEKREAMLKWGKYLGALVGEGQTAPRNLDLIEVAS